MDLKSVQESVSKKGEYYFCYKYYRELWASVTPQEREHSKLKLKEAKKIYNLMCSPNFINYLDMHYPTWRL